MTPFLTKLTAAMEASDCPLWQSALVVAGWAGAVVMMVCGVRS